MTAIYIANPTNQRQIVSYRLDYNKAGELNENRNFQPAKQQEVPPGGQVRLGAGDFHLTQVNDIVEQLTPYGLIAVKELGRLPAGKKIPYVFNIDLVVPPEAIRRVQQHNANVMVAEGRDRRQNAAVATNEIVQQTVQQQFIEQGIPAQPADTTAVTFEQLEQSELGESTIAEGFEIVPEGKVGPRSGKPAARASRSRKGR